MEVPGDVLLTPLVWSDDWLVGIPLIDTQHNRLFQIIEELRVSFLQNKSDDVVGKTLHGLISYCGEHFESEELLLHTGGYPIAESHATLHRNFTKKAEGWAKELEQGNLNSEVLLKTLVEWLVSHVLTHDIEYANFFRKKNFDTHNIATVSDLENYIRNAKGNRLSRFPLVYGFGILTTFILCILAWVCFWKTDLRGITFGISAALVIFVEVFQFWYIKLFLREQSRTLRLQHARRLSEALLAGEIAKKVTVLNFEGIENLFTDSEGFLVHTLKEIVDHLKIFVPYIPSTIVCLIRGEDEENDDEENLADNPSQQRSSARPDISATISAASPSTRASVDKYGRQSSGSKSAEIKEGYMGLLLEEVHSYHSDDTSNPHRKSMESSRSSKSKRTYCRSIVSKRKNSSVGPTSKLIDTLGRWIQKKSISLLTADIAEFEKMVALMQPVELLDMHCKYIVLVQDICKSTKGIFSQMDGDRVLISFNAANACGNHAEQACNAALKLRDMVRATDGHLHGAKIRIGIASGWTNVGNMGSMQKLSFCILGHIPLLVGALCDFNQQAQTEILICQQTCRDVRDTFLTKIVAPVELVLAKAANVSTRKFSKRPSEVPRPSASTSSASASTSAVVVPPPQQVTVSPLPPQFTYELKCSVSRVLDEWMYAIHDSNKNNPYVAYHDAAKAIFGSGGTFEAGLKQLESYCQQHTDDFQAHNLLRICTACTADTIARLSWKFGWSSPN